MKNRKILISLLALILIGCGSSSSNTATIISDCNRTFSTYGSLIYSDPDRCHVTVTASGATITFLATTDLISLTLKGSNNLLIFEPGSVVDVLIIDGNDNTLQASIGYAVSIDQDNGTGNIVIYL